MPLVSSIHPTSAPASGYELLTPVQCLSQSNSACTFNRTHDRAKENKTSTAPPDPLSFEEFIAFNKIYGLDETGTGSKEGTQTTSGSGPTQNVWPFVLDIKGSNFGAEGDELQTTVVGGVHRVNRSCANRDARCESENVGIEVE